MSTHPNTARHYDENAENYHRHVSDPSDGTFHAYYEKPAIRAELPELNGLEVISIGCGSGVDARWLADNGAKRVVGIDISKGLLEIAKSNNPDIEFREMDMEKLDFPDESFDLAYSSLAIHYIDDWTPALEEARRVLRPEGQYIFSCGHPIDSAMEYTTEGKYKYARLGRRVDTETDERIVYGDYLAPTTDGVKPVTGVLKDIEVVVYHRTFAKMIEQILASGFTIERVVEPQPIEGDPKHFEQLTRIPTFMIWVLRKRA
ncbi:class I SAM-dependent methyltransferase [Candidatus Saccharibacteria bacterium]|nr:class I SAM-dependent methyltransferase [Candidatus Saccharibacteria bacterium]